MSSLRGTGQDDVLALTRNIARTYKEADTNAKRAYLNFFFEKILVENKKVVNTQYQPVIDVLNKAKLGILTTNGLPLKDLFCNREIEFGITLSDLKIAFENLGLSQPMPTFAIQSEPNKPFASKLV